MRRGRIFASLLGLLLLTGCSMKSLQQSLSAQMRDLEVMGIMVPISALLMATFALAFSALLLLLWPLAVLMETGSKWMDRHLPP